jgi:hypothetical protein
VAQEAVGSIPIFRPIEKPESCARVFQWAYALSPHQGRVVINSQWLLMFSLLVVERIRRPADEARLDMTIPIFRPKIPTSVQTGVFILEYY